MGLGSGLFRAGVGVRLRAGVGVQVRVSQQLGARSVPEGSHVRGVTRLGESEGVAQQRHLVRVRVRVRVRVSVRVRVRVMVRVRVKG